MTEISSESECNDLRKRIVMEESVSDEEIRSAIAFMRQQRAENGGKKDKKSNNVQSVNLDDLLNDA